MIGNQKTPFVFLLCTVQQWHCDVRVWTIGAAAPRQSNHEANIPLELSAGSSWILTSCNVLHVPLLLYPGFFGQHIFHQSLVSGSQGQICLRRGRLVKDIVITLAVGSIPPSFIYRRKKRCAIVSKVCCSSRLSYKSASSCCSEYIRRITGQPSRYRTIGVLVIIFRMPNFRESIYPLSHVIDQTCSGFLCQLS